MSFSILPLKGYTSFLGFCLRYTKLLSDDTISIDSFKLNDQFDLMSMYVYYIILVYINTYLYFFLSQIFSKGRPCKLPILACLLMFHCINSPCCTLKLKLSKINNQSIKINKPILWWHLFSAVYAVLQVDSAGLHARGRPPPPLALPALQIQIQQGQKCALGAKVVFLARCETTFRGYVVPMSVRYDSQLAQRQSFLFTKSVVPL